MPLWASMDVAGAAVVGDDIDEVCQKITWRPRWNLLDSAVIRYPAHLLSITEGVSELHLYSDPGRDISDLVFSGPCWYSQAEGGPDAAYMEITAYDHRICLQKLLCKKPSASGAWNLIRPTSVILDEETAPEILAAFIQNAIDDPARASYDPAGPESYATPSKDVPITLGTVDTGGTNVTGVPMDWPMSIDRMRALLTATGRMDQVLVPGLGSSELHLLNNYDNDVSGSVQFSYATAPFNCQVATRTIDMKDVINALWFLLGPRCSPLRWKGSITPTAPDDIGGTWPSDLTDRIQASRETYGYMQEVQQYDDEGGECDDTSAGANAVRPLYEEEWAREAWLRALPRVFASVRPERGTFPSGWGVGDLIGVAAGTDLAGGFSGDQHVYGFDLSTDYDGVDEIEEIITSPDQMGAP